MGKIVTKESIQNWLDKGWILKTYIFTHEGKVYRTTGEYFTFSGKLVYIIRKE